MIRLIRGKNAEKTGNIGAGGGNVARRCRMNFMCIRVRGNRAWAEEKW